MYSRSSWVVSGFCEALRARRSLTKFWIHFAFFPALNLSFGLGASMSGISPWICHATYKAGMRTAPRLRHWSALPPPPLMSYNRDEISNNLIRLRNADVVGHPPYSARPPHAFEPRVELVVWLVEPAALGKHAPSDKNSLDDVLGFT